MKRERQWMYERYLGNKKPNIEYAKGVRGFLEIARADAISNNREGEIRCPCAKCKNCVLLCEPNVRIHLYSKVFCENYYTGIVHGETMDDEPETSVDIVENPRAQSIEHALRPTIEPIVREKGLNFDELIPNEEITCKAPNPKVEVIYEAPNPKVGGGKTQLQIHTEGESICKTEGEAGPVAGVD